MHSKVLHTHYTLLSIWKAFIHWILSVPHQGAFSWRSNFVFLMTTLITFDWLIKFRNQINHILSFSPPAIQLPAQADGGTGRPVPQRAGHIMAHVYDMGRSQPSHHVPAEHEGPVGHAGLALGFFHQPQRCRLPNQVNDQRLPLLRSWLMLGLSVFSQEPFRFIGLPERTIELTPD